MPERRSSFPYIEDEDGIFLFLSKSKSITAWSDSNREHTILKNSEFYIRTFISYQLGKFVSYEDIGHAAQYEAGELYTRLARIAHDHASKRSGKRPIGTRTVLSAIEDIRKDAAHLYNIARREKIEGLYEESTDAYEDNTHSYPYVSPEALSLFLKTLNILYQFGRRPYIETDSPDNVETILSTNELKWLRGFGGSFKLKQLINQELLNPEKINADRLLALRLKLRTFEIYRDLGRWLASGAHYWAGQVGGKLNILIIDEYLGYPDATNPAGDIYLEQLKNIYRALDMKGMSVDRVSTPVLENLREYLSGRKDLACERLESFGVGRVGTKLSFYHLILVEVDFSGANLGPTIVQKLTAHFDQGRDPGSDYHWPRIIVLSRQEKLGTIQQCLNLGAVAYIMKERPYALPSRIAKTRLPYKQTEPRGRKSNFRSLYQMQPQDIVKVHDELIRGYTWDSLDRQWLAALPKADLHHHIGTCITLPTIEALAFNTVGYLLSNIKKPVGGRTSSDNRSETKNQIAVENLALKNLDEIIERVCQIVIWAGVLNKAGVLHNYPPAKLLWTATNSVLHMEDNHDSHEARTKIFPDRDVYDAIIKLITRNDRQIASFEVCSLLVAAICLTGGTSPEKSMFASYKRNQWDYLTPARVRVKNRWSYLDDLQAWANTVNGDGNSSSQNNTEPSIQEQCIRGLLKRTANHCQIITKAAWGRGLTRNWSETNFPFVYTWQGCFKMVSERIERATDRLNEYFNIALVKLREGLSRVGGEEQWWEQRLDNAKGMLMRIQQWPPSPNEFDLPSLTDFVKIPEVSESSEVKDQSLLRYLWGAGLLGADHLQYPENIMLAGKDIVEEAVRDNIAYSELRCATTGYCAGGMSAVDATDLLCHSLDVAAAYTAIEKHDRWVRINILLGAKRHKSEEDFQDIVSLLTNYLQRGEWSIHMREDLSTSSLSRIAPKWWKPSRVVGFDLSGDETADSRRSEDMMNPLFKLSTPITIHAGEAATAENIWNAVYRFGARRIGHGLRLRENTKLLNYCISEGVCIEMCPISNQFTNGFVNIDDPKDYDGSWRQYYPLRHNIEEGLDVCINTDNRQLHGDKTLTDDYMCAARMSGGLTKWQILKIIKAGFKHAFLPKPDIEALLTAMEDEVYNLIVDRKNDGL